MTPHAFERALEAWLPAGEVRRVSAAALSDLSSALDRGDLSAVRAAVLLARTGAVEAGEALLVRLERRVSPQPELEKENAADVVAGAAFAEGLPGPGAAQRLETLAAGAKPHPDLEVRVECARSALRLGRDGVVPFLLRVLREGTPAGLAAPDWKRKADESWAQRRAADALSARAGVTCRFRPEASVRDRENEIARLESLLPRPAPRKKS